MGIVRSLKSITGKYHALVMEEGKFYYLCNKAVGDKPYNNLSAHNVTCFNCLDIKNGRKNKR